MSINALIPLMLGSIVGLVLSITGAGGAILSVPLLTFGMSLSITQAGPIGLLAVTISAGIGTFFGLRAKILRYKAAMLMAFFGLLLAPFGIVVAHLLPNEPLTLIFALVLSFSAIRMLKQANNELKGIQEMEIARPPCILDDSIGKLIWTLPCARSLAFSGAMAGFFSGLLGVGGGFIIVPSLKKFTDLPMTWIVATSLGVLTIVSLGGVITSTIYGNMNWYIAIPFACGALLGMLVGTQIAKRISGPRIQQIFGTFSLLIAISMGIKAVILLNY